MFGELVKGEWSELLPIGIEILAFGILGIEILRYARSVLQGIDDTAEKKPIQLYFLGFIIWIAAGPLAVVIGNIPGIPLIISNSWTLVYSLGLLIVAYTVARNPRMLFISEAKPTDLMILNKDGVMLFSHRFYVHPESVEPELMGSAMSGILSLLGDMFHAETELNRIDYGDLKILVESGMLTTFLLSVSKETVRFRQSLIKLQMEFEINFCLLHCIK